MKTKTEIKLEKQIQFNRKNKELFSIETLNVIGRNHVAAARRMAARGEIEIIDEILIDGKAFSVTIKL